MASSKSETQQAPFALLTPRLIIVPTPTAISLPSYRALYGSLHGNASFCEMAFGHHLSPMDLSDEQTHEMIKTRDIIRCWERRGMGDFAVGVRAKTENTASAVYGKGRLLGSGSNEVWIFEGEVYNELVGSGVQPLEHVEWAGYAGVRDATTTSIPIQDDGYAPMEPWQEMIELRYGVGLNHWGQGIAKEAAEAVMQWAVSERGARRFIAETEKENTRSGRVLEKMGFSLSGTNYWREPSELEWERIPQ